MENVSEYIQSLEPITSNGSSFSVRYYEAKKLPNSLFEWAFNLFEENMKTMYENSEWGWKPRAKKKELTSRKARYLLVFKLDKAGNESPVGFTHFRFDMDYGRKVVYCYELHLEAGARGQKIGSWIMKLLETLASNANCSRVVLTVLKANHDAIEFYKKAGYDLDETSPGKSEGRSYYIYSKVVPSLPND